MTKTAGQKPLPENPFPEREWKKEYRSLQLHELCGSLSEVISQVKDLAKGLKDPLFHVDSQGYEGYTELAVAGYRKRNAKEIQTWDEVEQRRIERAKKSAERKRLRALEQKPAQIEKQRKEDLKLLEQISKRNPDLILTTGTEITVNRSPF